MGDVVGCPGLGHGRRRNASGGGPLLDGSQIFGGLYVPTDGLARAAQSVEALPQRATARGAALPRVHQRSPTSEQAGGRVTGVRTDRGRLPGRHRRVVRRVLGPHDIGAHDRHGRSACCRWRTSTSRPTGSTNWSGATPKSAEAGLPILRHQDQDLVLPRARRPARHRLYAHRPMPVEESRELDPAASRPRRMPSMLPFTEEDFAPSWEQSQLLLPAPAADAKIEAGFNGIFSFTPDGPSLIGESA